MFFSQNSLWLIGTGKAARRNGISAGKEKKMQTNCDFCAYNEYDEEDDCYYCSINMDEDEIIAYTERDSIINEIDDKIA